MQSLFSENGITKNFELFSNSFGAWYETLSGTRCANSAECSNKRTKKVKQSPEPEIDYEMLKQLEAAEIERIKQKELETVKQRQFSQISEQHRTGRQLTGEIAPQFMDNTTYVDGEYVMGFTRSCESSPAVLEDIINVYICNGQQVTTAGHAFYNGQTDYTCTTNSITRRTGCWCRNSESITCTNNHVPFCSVTILDPDFSKPCKDSTHDGPFYTYSNAGYDP